MLGRVCKNTKFGCRQFLSLQKELEIFSWAPRRFANHIAQDTQSEHRGGDCRAEGRALLH